MKEDLYSFVIDHSTRKLPFYVELTGITYPDPSYEIRREKSQVCVLEYIIEGSGTVEVNGETFYPSAGDVYLLPPGSRQHYFSSKDTPFQKIWMNVGGDLCSQLLSLYGLTGKYWFQNVDASPYFYEFLELCKQPIANTQILFDQCSVIFLQILQQISRCTKKESTPNPSVLLAKNFCDNHIYSKVTASDTAKYASLSVSQLNRLFKQAYGCTVYSYILNSKIRTAKSLLQGTSLPISEIAYRLCFSDEHYFSNIFRQKTGMSPSDFRKNS